MSENLLFSPYSLGGLLLKNRMVMAPMTRSRAINNLPNDLMAEYYAQRADAGLMITEGVSPSANGLGYARIPGIFNQPQVDGWKKVTQSVHDRGGRIFVQLMHSGRIGHALNLPMGGKLLAPSAVQAKGQVWTDSAGMQDIGAPEAMSQPDIEQTRDEFIQAAKNAMEAGFDGVELHGANGYLLEQFLSPFTNIRADQYGGKLENRARFVLDVARGVAKAIGQDKVGIRLSPFGIASDMKPYDDIQEMYSYLAQELGRLGILYLHVVDHSSMGAPVVPASIKEKIRKTFPRTLILAGGYNKHIADLDLREGKADLIAFGKPFINNPDLVSRLERNWPLSETLDKATLYSASDAGYTDYPFFQESTVLTQ
jgi:N-ethylmaleimide reductase